MTKTDSLIAEMHTDIKWIKESLNKKANKWTERVLIFGMVGVGAWVINQVLNLVPTVSAFLK